MEKSPAIIYITEEADELVRLSSTELTKRLDSLLAKLDGFQKDNLLLIATNKYFISTSNPADRLPEEWFRGYLYREWQKAKGGSIVIIATEQAFSGYVNCFILNHLYEVRRIKG